MPNTQTQKPISTNHHLGLRVHPGSLLYEGGNAWLPAAERETGPRKLGMRKLLLCLRGTGAPPDSLCGYPASFVVCRSQGKRLLCTCLEGLKRPSGGLWGISWGQQSGPFYSHSLSRCQPLNGVVNPYILWSGYPPTQVHPMAKLPRPWAHMYHRSTQLPPGQEPERRLWGPEGLRQRAGDQTQQEGEPREKFCSGPRSPAQKLLKASSITKSE